jgi:hypothetical protein
MMGKSIASFAPGALVGLMLCVEFAAVTGLSAQAPKTPANPPANPPAKTSEGDGKGDGKVVGILTHFEYNWTKAHGPKPDTRLSLKAEGETESVDYLLALPNEAVDPKLEAILKKVFPSNTATVQWEMRNGKRLVTNVKVLTPTGGQGVKRGTVIARDAGYVDVKGENRGDLTIRYVVPYDVKAKAPKPALSAAIQRLNVGDRVAVTWIANPERVWASQVKVVSAAAK